MDNIKNDRYYLNKMVADLEFMIEQTKAKTENKAYKKSLFSLKHIIGSCQSISAKMT